MFTETQGAVAFLGTHAHLSTLLSGSWFYLGFFFSDFPVIEVTDLLK